MKRFADTEGRNWDITLNIRTVKRIRDVLGVDLLNLDKGDPPLATQLATDVVLVCDVIFIAIESQAEKAGVNDEAFGVALGGEAINRAYTAFFEELSDFFRQLGRTDLAQLVTTQLDYVRALVEKQEAGVNLAGTKAKLKLGELNLDEMIDARLKNLGEPSIS